MSSQNTKYISLHEAAKMTDYSQEYISLLCRRGKIKGEKLGRNWFTTKEWISNYVNKIKESKEVKKNKTDKNEEEVVLVKIENKTGKMNGVAMDIADERNEENKGKTIETSLDSFSSTKKMMLATVIFSIIVSGFVFVQYGMKQDLILGVLDSVSQSVQKGVVSLSDYLNDAKNEAVKFAGSVILRNPPAGGDEKSRMNTGSFISLRSIQDDIKTLPNSLNAVSNHSRNAVATISSYSKDSVIFLSSSLDAIKNESTRFADNKITVTNNTLNDIKSKAVFSIKNLNNKKPDPRVAGVEDSDEDGDTISSEKNDSTNEERDGLVIVPLEGDIDSNENRELIKNINSSFSDEVDVSLSEDGVSGIINPKNNPEENYLYLIVPVNKE